MSSSSLAEVRPMKPEDIPGALEVWRQIGLDEGTHALNTWYGVDPEGFYAAIAENGEVIGTCTCIINAQNLAFVGLYAVLPHLQGKGIGKKIWDKCIERIGDRNAGLNAVPARVNDYRFRAGFSIMADWMVWCCKTSHPRIDRLPEELPGVSVVKPGKDEDKILAIVQFDATVHGYKREKAVRLTLQEGDSLTFAAMKDGKCIGYGTIKRSILGSALIGPLLAEDCKSAKLLMRHLLQNFPVAFKEGLTLIASSNNPTVSELIDDIGLKVTIELPRCYTKKEVAADFSKVFGQHAWNFSPF